MRGIQILLVNMFLGIYCVESTKNSITKSLSDDVFTLSNSELDDDVFSEFELRDKFYSKFMEELEKNHSIFQQHYGTTTMAKALLTLAHYQERKVYEKLKELSYAQVFTIFDSCKDSKDKYLCLEHYSERVGVLHDKKIAASPIFFYESLYPQTFRLWYKVYFFCQFAKQGFIAK